MHVSLLQFSLQWCFDDAGAVCQIDATLGAMLPALFSGVPQYESNDAVASSIM